MSKKQVLNTSCKATFKNGQTKEFSSIEEASKETGISIQAIKIRCNKPGTGGKDRTTFEWLDEHTKLSYRAKKSRTKGKDLEYRVRDKLREIGYTGCERSAGESKKLDNSKVDICDVNRKLPINIQVKNYANTPNYFGIRNECPDKSKPFCLCWKKNTLNSDNIIYMVPEDFFYKLLDAYTKQNKIL